VTGSVTDDAVEQAMVEASDEVTNFTCGSHFYEQVEDTKDSVWLVKVVSSQHGGPVMLSDTGWKAIRKKVAKFGVRVGIFDCSLDWR
jgi:E3 ubiquitin-protein ligase RNF103